MGLKQNFAVIADAVEVKYSKKKTESREQHTTLTSE